MEHEQFINRLREIIKFKVHLFPCWYLFNVPKSSTIAHVGLSQKIDNGAMYARSSISMWAGICFHIFNTIECTSPKCSIILENELLENNHW